MLWSTLHGANRRGERVGERQTLVRITAPVPGMLSEDLPSLRSDDAS